MIEECLWWADLFSADNFQGKMDIRNEKDADICLQLANFLTVSLLKYRTKQVKNMASLNVEDSGVL